jgi:hypothetical protein
VVGTWGLVLAAACGSDRSSDGRPTTGEIRSIPELYDADVGVAAEGVWVAGGALLIDGRWHANERVLTFDTDGKIVDDQALQLSRGHFLFDSQVVEPALGDRWLVGVECGLPGDQDDSLGCGLATKTVAGRLTGDGPVVLSKVELPEIVGAREAGPGVSRVLGPIEGKIVILRAESVGSLGGGFYNFNVYLWDPSTGDLVTLEIPKGVQTFESFCRVGSTIRMIEPEMAIDPLRVERVTVLEMDPLGKQIWTPVSSIDLRGTGTTTSVASPATRRPPFSGTVVATVAASSISIR